VCGEISRPAADSAACRPVEAAPSHPEAAADPSGCLAGAYHLAAAASAHSSGTSSAVEAASFLLAADRPAAECLETADYHPAAAVSVRSSEASSAVVAVSRHLAAGQPGAEYGFWPPCDCEPGCGGVGGLGGEGGVGGWAWSARARLCGPVRLAPVANTNAVAAAATPKRMGFTRELRSGCCLRAIWVTPFWNRVNESHVTSP
jgi:hypothetical protein